MKRYLHKVFIFLVGHPKLDLGCCSSVQIGNAFTVEGKKPGVFCDMQRGVVLDRGFEELP